MMTKGKAFRGKNAFRKSLEYNLHLEWTPENSVSGWLENYKLNDSNILFTTEANRNTSRIQVPI